MNEEVLNTLNNWKGPEVNSLKHLYEKHFGKVEFWNDLLDLYQIQALEIPATWMFKNHYRYKRKLQSEQIDIIINYFNQLGYWESRLHVLQLIPEFKINKRQAELLEKPIYTLLKSETKFVRAAAYEAYFEVVKNIPELSNEFKEICLAAQQTESASVLVKIRRILKLLDRV